MPLTLEALQELVDKHREQAEEHDQHRRREHDSLERRMSASEASHGRMADQIAHITDALSRPVEVSTLRFTPSMVFSIVAVCASIAGAGWVVNSNVDQLSSEMRTQTKIQDECKR